MSRITKAALLLAVFFALDKALALLRYAIIARQFGLSPELDAFNVANNIPDMLFALISGGALAMAFIPVLTGTLTRSGQKEAWDLFSRIANLAFLVTAAAAILVGLMAELMVRWRLGIAPGFQPSQQLLVADLMRLNLVATLIFSISGLVMAGLQANQHFLLPAIAPLLYNLGQIGGAVILSPTKGTVIGPVQLPAFGMGIHGLVIGVIIGAILHLGIQIPGLIKYHFHWTPRIDLNSPQVKKVLRLIGPRLVTMFFIQLTFIIRDNLASRLEPGAVTALTYGWMIMQVPETLLGSAIGTALLPSLAEQIAKNDLSNFKVTLEKAISVIMAIAFPAAVILSFGLRPLLALIFGFSSQGTDLLLWVTRGYLLGLAGQCLLEVAARSFYARQDALTPLLAAFLNAIVYSFLGWVLFQKFGAAGISLGDSLAFTFEAILLLLLLNRKLLYRLNLGTTLIRALGAATLGGLVLFALSHFTKLNSMGVTGAVVAFVIAATAALPLVIKEIRLLVRL